MNRRRLHWRLLWLCGLAGAGWAAPQPAPAAADPVPDWRYTLRPGDTLIGVSARYLARPADWPRLQRYNRIADPYRLIPGSPLRIPLAWLRQTPAPATVLAVAGDVSVALAAAPPRPLQAGEALAAGAVIVTAADSSATVRFADGSLLVLQPRTRLALDTVSVSAGGGMVDTRLRLQQGRAELRANPQRAPGSRLQVITPAAVAAVRGTRFRVAADAQAAREETLEGEVALTASGQRVDVGAGQGSVAETGRPPRPPVALLPAPDVAALPARIELLPLRFVLPAQPGAAGWLGQIAPDTRFETILRETSTTDPTLRFADLADGRYALRVRAADAQGLQGRDAIHAFEVDARPFPPLLAAPGERVREARPALRWHAVLDVDAYQVELARDAGFADRVEARRVDGVSMQPAEALPPGTYHWRVASVDDGAQGPFSPPRRFVHDPLPAAPELAAATPAFAAGGLSLALPPPPAGLRYDLVLSRDPGRETVVWQGESADGQLRATPVEPADYYLAARLVEVDGSAGPYATRLIEAPPARWAPLLLLLPLLLAL